MNTLEVHENTLVVHEYFTMYKYNTFQWNKQA